MAAARFYVFRHAFRHRAESDGTGCGEKKCFFSRTENFSPEKKVLLGLTKENDRIQGKHCGRSLGKRATVSNHGKVNSYRSG